MDKVSTLDLKLDYALYPRASLNEGHVIDLQDALDLGVKFPPVVAWRATKQVIDGFHRITAVKRQRGENARIEVEWRDYASEADAFADAVRLNASHGLRLRQIDHEEAFTKAQWFGMTEDAFAMVAKVPTYRLRKRTTQAVTKPASRPMAPVPPKDADDFVSHHGELSPLRHQPILDKHPVLVVAGQRMDDVRDPQREFSEGVRDVVAAKKGDPESLWTHLVETAAAALTWAGKLDQAEGAV